MPAVWTLGYMKSFDIPREAAKLTSVKGLIAILFGVALVVSQAAFVTESGGVGNQPAGTPACCGHCGRCRGQSCCTCKNDPRSHPPAPAVPAHGVSQNDLQLFAAVAIDTPAPTVAQSVASSSSDTFRLAVSAPLYQRDCSYLI